MPNPSPNASFGARASHALRRLLITVIVLGLTGAVVFLLSERNSRTYSVEVADGKLVVMKGRMLPLGTEPYRPSDSALQEAYAPFELHGHPATTLVDARFKDREELDHSLFSFLESLARPEVTSDEPRELEDGLQTLRRMERLHGMSDEQHKTLRSLQAEVAYYQARLRLDEARKDLGEAIVQLKVAADAPTHNARSAQQMVLEVEAPAKALEEALRRAVHQLSTPASATGPEPSSAGDAEKKELPLTPAATDGGSADKVVEPTPKP